MDFLTHKKLTIFNYYILVEKVDKHIQEKPVVR